MQGHEAHQAERIRERYFIEQDQTAPQAPSSSANGVEGAARRGFKPLMGWDTEGEGQREAKDENPACGRREREKEGWTCYQH